MFETLRQTSTLLPLAKWMLELLMRLICQGGELSEHH